ncbi:hypothetical protein CEK25_008750 [Fusarium fujikuroi]|nr:hypothetical protein CEK25_008750 [Fusarium fujikuroi]
MLVSKKSLAARLVSSSSGDDVLPTTSLARYAREQNVTSLAPTVVAALVLQAAHCDNKAPVILQFSQGGAEAYFAGKGVPLFSIRINILTHSPVVSNTDQAAHCLYRAAHYVRSLAPTYGIPGREEDGVHTDHCAKKLLYTWLDGMLDADEAYFPLFSSHMIDAL